MQQVLKFLLCIAGIVVFTMPSHLLAASDDGKELVEQDELFLLRGQTAELVRQDEMFFLEQENKKLKEKLAVKDAVIAAGQAQKDSLVLRVVDLEKKASVANMFLEENALKIKALSSEKGELDAQLQALAAEKDALAGQVARLKKQLLEIKSSVEKEAVLAADAEAKLAIERIRSGAAKSIEAARLEAEKSRQLLVDENAALKEQLAQKSAVIEEKEKALLKATVEKEVLAERFSSAEAQIKDLRAKVLSLERR